MEVIYAVVRRANCSESMRHHYGRTRHLAFMLHRQRIDSRRVVPIGRFDLMPLRFPVQAGAGPIGTGFISRHHRHSTTLRCRRGAGLTLIRRLQPLEFIVADIGLGNQDAAAKTLDQVAAD